MFYTRILRINKRILLSSVLLVFCISVQAQRPNIIYIMTDDMGYGDLSGYGRKEYKTPHLDRLASQGMKFVNAYAAAPLCTPTRVALMTGRYPARTPVGLIEPLTSTKKDSSYGLNADIPSIASLIKKEGYETALVGKWHLGFLPAFSPTQNGFDYFYGMHSGAADYISHKGDGSHDLYEMDSMVYPDGYLTDLFTGKAIDFIRKERNKPFLLMLTYNAPHWPWQGAGDKAYPDSVNFRAGGSPAVFAAMMKSVDEGIGKLLQTLDETQLSDNTLLIFTNDNGGERYSNHGGLSGNKGLLWEGGIRVPAFVRWPGKIKPGQVTQQVAVTMDWTATMLAAAGARPAKDFPVDGINLLPVLTGKKNVSTRTLYWRVTQRAQQKAVRMGEWKYLQDEKGEYLFNLAKDQAEKEDQKATEAGIFKRLKKMLSRWEGRMLQPVPLYTAATE